MHALNSAALAALDPPAALELLELLDELAGLLPQAVRVRATAATLVSTTPVRFICTDFILSGSSPVPAWVPDSGPAWRTSAQVAGRHGSGQCIIDRRSPPLAPVLRERFPVVMSAAGKCGAGRVPASPARRYAVRPSGTQQAVDWPALRAAAVEAMRSAYAPYSRFPVGVAGLVDDGRMVTGCNVENASYGLSLCAECGMVGDLARTGGGRLVAVACVGGDGQPLMPCGRCRQLLWEHGGAEMLIETVSRGIVPVREVLPDAFGPDDLVAAGVIERP